MPTGPILPLFGDRVRKVGQGVPTQVSFNQIEAARDTELDCDREHESWWLSRQMFVRLHRYFVFVNLL